MLNKILFNRKELKSFRSSLRKRSTSAEAALWELKIELDGDLQSTTPAAYGLCNTLTIIMLRPPLLEKEGKLILISALVNLGALVPSWHFFNFKHQTVLNEW